MSDTTPTLRAADLLAGQLALELSDAQVEHLCTAHSLKRPLRLGGPAHAAPITEGTERDRLRELAIVTDAGLAPWFRSLWRTISSSPVLVIVDRVVGDTSYRWAYPTDRGSFCEQAETDAGYVWLFASHLHLLPRILLVSGLLRFSNDPDRSRLDPLATATAWTTHLSVHRRGMPRSAVRTLAMRVEGDHIELLPAGGDPNRCAPAAAVDAVTGLLRGLARP